MIELASDGLVIAFSNLVFRGNIDEQLNNSFIQEKLKSPMIGNKPQSTAGKVCPKVIPLPHYSLSLLWNLCSKQQEKWCQVSIHLKAPSPTLPLLMTPLSLLGTILI